MCVCVCVCVCVIMCVSELIRMHVTFKSLKVGLVYNLVSVATSINLISPIQINQGKKRLFETYIRRFFRPIEIKIDIHLF